MDVDVELVIGDNQPVRPGNTPDGSCGGALCAGLVPRRGVHGEQWLDSGGLTGRVGAVNGRHGRDE